MNELGLREKDLWLGGASHGRRLWQEGRDSPPLRCEGLLSGLCPWAAPGAAWVERWLQDGGSWVC